ncbi:hypothetical protein B0H63DRAFT_468019 [Podospora didyma]|uniref:Uncharacterized protein n=1 Tax=Podospora didyma TaxID=330526 RepID=A0AAE0NRX7_9PEZI|nr:hypothetical protein B0H63DRAFT_468019 [Podospora didyma]
MEMIEVISTSPLDEQMLRSVYASDQEMYPVAALSLDRLRSWVDACPDLSICFFPAPTPTSAEDDINNSYTNEPSSALTAVTVGVIIALPLRRAYWEDLLVGKVKEPEIDPAVMFPGSSSTKEREKEDDDNEEEEEVGVHVFHIERLVVDSSGFLPMSTTSSSPGPGPELKHRKKKRFAEVALDEIIQRATRMKTKMKETNKRWRVVGLSALTATPAGKKSFHRMGFTSTGYREILFVRGAPTVPVTAVVSEHHQQSRIATALKTSSSAVASPATASNNNSEDVPVQVQPVVVEMKYLYPGGDNDDEQGEKDTAACLVEEMMRIDGCTVVSTSEMTVKYIHHS